MLGPLVNYINENYGSKRGLLNEKKTKLFYCLGKYRKLQQIDWVKAERLVFVCAGNICRSPLAELYAKSKGFNVESFGLACGDDYPADPRAVRYASAIGIDLSAHRTRNISHYQPSANDLLVAMEPCHLELLERGVADAVQLTLAGLWLRPAYPYLHDPFNTSASFFDRCEGKVISATDGLLAQLKVCGG